MSDYLSLSIMNLRSFIFIFFVLLFSTFNIPAFGETNYLMLNQEPIIRIGLATNAQNVSITTTDSTLVAVSVGEPNKFLEANKITVAARSYRPPEYEIYHFEIPNLATQTEADALAKEVREATNEKTSVSLDAAKDTWSVTIGEKISTIEEANEFKTDLSDKGYEEAQMITEKVVSLSADAVNLSKQIAQNSKSEVRSLILSTPATTTPGGVKSIVSINPIADAVDPNLREVIVSGGSATSRFTSLKPIAFGSTNEHLTPVRFNGKAYRGRIEVFVNSRGTLSVVNAVSLEDYLLGVVPNELSLPAIEAQKAQAIAARTYAIANINQFGTQGFDILPTVRSQVYQGYSSESKMGTQAVTETRGIVATYKGKPINALYTSTCGGRTENSENVFDFAEPYLRGVECSLEGHKQFEPFLIKTVRQPAKLRDEKNLELARLMSLLAVNGFQLSTNQLTDDWFEDEPTQSEMSNWLNQLAVKFGKTFPNVNKDTAKPPELAHILATIIYGDAYADTLLSEADINYQLAFDDAAEVPKDRRADVAILFRDGYFALYPDLTLKPNKAFSRAKMLRLIQQIYTKKKWMPTLQTATAKSSADGKLVLKIGKSEKQIVVRPDVFLLRQFGDDFYQVKETALVGGEIVNYQTNAAGEVVYLEVKPTDQTTTAERMSNFELWTVNLSPSAVQSRLSRYVRGIGNLIDVRVAQKGFSRRAIDLEIVGTNGTFHLKGGKIRSALKLNEQLFVINKRYDANGRAISYSFTGRGWGHGVGMCQFGAYGLAKMGVKYDAILKHYYTGIDLTKAY
ncbi:MAG: SpoIID/LytB domain-containing protein [Pyrinomonadaceae bacterium]